ncbi:glutamate receptor ionotropic, kainate 3-like isoform X2 [Bradysia coprophila]|nr:glutamate receptor ionotropic, kainate 3-like isoform X2 [Bradysia coprophila]
MNICDAKEIPYIDVNLDPNTKQPVINLHPHPEALAQMFVDIANASNWKGFTVVYESAPWLPRMAKLLKLYDPKSYTITLRRINVGLHKTNFRPVLRRVKVSGETNIVLDCSIETLPELLKQAQQVGLMTENHQFIITTMDMHTIDLEPYQFSGTNITAIRLVNPASPMMGHITKCLDESTENNGEYESFRNDPYGNDDEERSESLTTSTTISVQAALIFDAVLLLAEAFKQFDPRHLRPKMLNCNDNAAWDIGNSIANFMRNTIVEGLTGEIRFDNRGYRSHFAADVIELTSSGIAQVGTWNATLPDRLNITRHLDGEFVTEIDDGSMKNKTFIVLTALSPPYGMLRDSTLKLSGNDRFEGFGIELIHELSLMFGFNYEFQLQEDKDYGVKNNATGEWSGMMRELIDGRADLAITDLTITSERESGVDFTMPFMNLGISILYRKPKKEPPSTFSFMAPFSTEVWLYLGGAYLGVSLCLFILGRISPSEWDNPYPCIEEPTELLNQFSFSNSLWFSTGALLQQGSEIAPKAPSTRAVATTWWFFTLIMVSSYTANLAAFLTVENKESAIKDVEDLKNCHLPETECPVEFGAKKTGSTINFFKESDHSTYKNMHTYMMSHPEFLTDDNNQGLERAKTGKYAFLMESSSIEYFIERNCDLTQVGTPLDEKGYGIAMRKDSVYRSALSEGVLRLQEQGKLTSMKNKWWKEKTKGTVCVEKETGEAQELNMDNMKGVFYVLLTGSAFASLYAVIEWLIIILLHAKRDNVPFKQELMDEMKFIIKCSGNTKTVRHRQSTSMDSRHSIESEGSGSSKDSNRHYGDK